MDVFKLIDLSLFAQLILFHLIIHNLKNSSSKDPSTRFFIGILVALSAVNILELTSWIYRSYDSSFFYYVNYLTISALLALNSLPSALWIRYIDYKIFGDAKNANRRLRFYLIPFYISLMLVVLNPFTDIVFNLPRTNIYSRNFGMYIIVGLTLTTVLIVFILSRRFKKHIHGRVLESIFWFLLIPISAGFIQILFFGIPLIWPAFTLATLISFNLIEVDSFLKDPLTKLNTRGQFENRLTYKLKRKSNFSLIMIDLNDFKLINDQYGHEEGDEALIKVADVIHNAVKNYDSTCRYGGDEFMLLVDSPKESAAQIVIDRITTEITSYNNTNLKKYNIELSFGNAYVDMLQKISLKDLLAKVDMLMYQDKNSKKIK